MKKKITGSVVALVTPMLEDGSIDFKSLSKLVEWHCSSNTSGLVIVGTTGESPTVDLEEHIKLIESAKNIAGERIPIIAGTGANSTSEAIILTREAERIGVDASLQVTPYYNKPSQAGLERHFLSIADSTSLPIILYNVPGRTVADLANETVKTLSFHENIVGIKDATGDLIRGQWLLRELSPSFFVYSGDDPTAVPLILCGAAGNISVTANILPKTMAKLCKFALDGKAGEASRLNKKLLPIHRALFVESNPVPVKWLLYRLGFIGRSIRLPLIEPSDANKVFLENIITSIRELEGED